MAQQVDLYRLQAQLDLQSAQFEKGMAQAVRSMGRAEARSKKLSKSMKTAGKQISSFAKAGLALAGLSFSTSFLKGIVETNSALAKSADAVGIGVESFQAYTFAAERAGISAGQFSSNMTAFVKRVGEARNGVGPLVSGLKNMDKTLLDNIKNSKNQEEAFKIVADAIQTAETATEKAAIANAAFSRSGVGMVNMLNDGADGLTAMEEEAKKLGIVIGEDLVRASERYDDQMLDLSKRMKATFGKGFLTLVTTVMDNAGLVFQAFFATVDKLMAQLKWEWNTLFAYLKFAAQTFLARTIKPLLETMGRIPKYGKKFTDLSKGIKSQMQANVELQKSLKRVNEEREKSFKIADDTMTKSILAKQKEIEIRDEYAKTSKRLKDYTAALKDNAAAAAETADPPQLSALEKFRNRLIETQAELDRYNDYMKILEDAHKKGAISTKLFDKEMAALTGTVKEAEVKLTETQEALNNIGERGLGSIVDYAFDAKQSFSEFAASFIKDITKMIIQQQIFNSLQAAGGLSGIIGRGGGGGGGTGAAPTPAGFSSTPDAGSGLGGRPARTLSTSKLKTGTSTGTTVNVINQSGARAKVSERQTAKGKQINVLIEDALKQSIASGSQDRIMRSVYGIRRMGTT